MPSVQADTSAASLTTSAVANLLGVNKDKVLAWIRAGELRAINVATRRAAKQRPRFRILRDDLQVFLNRRATAGTTGKRPARRKSVSGGYPEFIPL